MSPMRDLRCVTCRRTYLDVYFRNTEEIDFECECGCREYEMLPPRINLPRDGKYSYREEK